MKESATGDRHRHWRRGGVRTCQVHEQFLFGVQARDRPRFAPLRGVPGRRRLGLYRDRGPV